MSEPNKCPKCGSKTQKGILPSLGDYDVCTKLGCYWTTSSGFLAPSAKVEPKVTLDYDPRLPGWDDGYKFCKSEMQAQLDGAKSDLKAVDDVCGKLADKLAASEAQAERYRKALEEIQTVAQSNPGGFMEPGTFDPTDKSPEDATVLNASIINSLCVKALTQPKEN